MKLVRYTRNNPKYKPGMVFVHKKNPEYIIKLLNKEKYFGRWLCEVIKGTPFNATKSRWVDGNTSFNVIPGSIPDSESAILCVEYSVCAFSRCFIQSEIAEILYNDNK